MFNPYTEEHDLFRQTVRQFAEKEIAPYADEWEAQKDFPSELFKKAGQLGIFGAHYPEAHGGSGGDYWFSIAKAQELPRSRCAGVTMALLVQSDMATPVISDLGTDEQIEEFLKPTLAGDKIVSIGVSEPGAGSDVAGIRTHARRDGTDYVLNGQKTFITNGARADYITMLHVLSGPNEDEGVPGRPQAGKDRQPRIGHCRAVPRRRAHPRALPPGRREHGLHVPDAKLPE